MIPEEEIHYIGFIASADPSLCKIKLKHGFKIETKSVKEVLGLISSNATSTPTEGYDKRFLEALNLTERDSVQCVENVFHSWGNTEGYFANHDPEGPERDDGFLTVDYLAPALRLMRFFKEGDLNLNFEIYFTVENGKGHLANIGGETSHKFGQATYSLSDEELPRLQALIDETKFPLKRGFLNLAFDFCELSSSTTNRALSFLSLMIAMEVLFNPGVRRGISQVVSQNVGKLLGEDVIGRAEIASNVKYLYDKRSKLVHEGIYDERSYYVKSVEDYYNPIGSSSASNPADTVKITPSDVAQLRDYVRQSIIKAIKIDKEKKQFLEHLH